MNGPTSSSSSTDDTADEKLLFERLDRVVAWMRSHRLTYASFPDGTALFFPEPPPPPRPVAVAPTSMSDAEQARFVRLQHERARIRNEILDFGASEGIPADIDAEIDRRLQRLEETELSGIA